MDQNSEELGGGDNAASAWARLQKLLRFSCMTNLFLANVVMNVCSCTLNLYMFMYA